MFFQAFTICTFATLTKAHFFFNYPEERGDTFAGDASQYIFPCANVNQTSSNRTIWPLDGGSLSLDLHHPWTYVFVNLGLGTTTSTFNISLTPDFYNVTGNGTFCLPKLILHAGTTPLDGQNATIQVVTSGRSGGALYNCADITFRSNATLLTDGTCTNSSNVVGTIVTQASTSTSTNTTTTGASATTTETKSAGSREMKTDVLGVALLGSILSFLL